MIWRILNTRRLHVNSSHAYHINDLFSLTTVMLLAQYPCSYTSNVVVVLCVDHIFKYARLYNKFYLAKAMIELLGERLCARM